MSSLCCFLVPPVRCTVSTFSVAAGVVAASTGLTSLSWLATGGRCTFDCSHKADRDLLAVFEGHLLCPTCLRAECPWSVALPVAVIALFVSFSAGLFWEGFSLKGVMVSAHWR